MLSLALEGTCVMVLGLREYLNSCLHLLLLLDSFFCCISYVKMYKWLPFYFWHTSCEMYANEWTTDTLSFDIFLMCCSRVMEIILQNRTLSNELRVPPVSRLQKIHNVDVALWALKNAGYVLTGNITAKDISDGHREKTLSLLWQIIYKFQVKSVYP